VSAEGTNGSAAAATAELGPPPEALVARVQELTERLAQLPDPAARESADELVSAILELYGEGLERIFAAIDGAGEGGTQLKERLRDDGLVASLMLIHDLYPVPLEERVREALESVRPYMESHGGNVELLEMKDGTARISLEGSCKTCPASTSTLELAIKQALDESAPDLEALIVEGAEAGQPMVSGSATELPVLQVAPGEAGVQPSWFGLAEAEQVAEGQVWGTEIEGVPLIVARVEGGLLAYRDRCAGCESAIREGKLDGGTLTCPECERNFHLPRAGRSLDDDRLQLEPVPLLGGPEGTRVALAA
jgi:Fe-S cluster biogenesis protein NfuA/nitrite reductase/ring-hydroxylating ferredoxin subunit